MKLIVEKQGSILKSIKAEYTPAEALIINHAMRRYTEDEGVNETDRAVMERMLDVEPTYSDMTESNAGITEDELKQHLYELSYALDNFSAGKDYVALRRTHYDNIEWLQNHGLTNEYYEVLFAHIKANRKDTE